MIRYLDLLKNEQRKEIDPNAHMSTERDFSDAPTRARGIEISADSRLVPRGEARRLIADVFHRLNALRPSGLEPDYAMQDIVDWTAMFGTRPELLAALGVWERSETLRAKEFMAERAA